MPKVKPVPDGFHTLNAHIVVRGCAQALEFYQRAFGAQELMRMPTPDGAIMHAELKIGDSTLMLVDEMPQMGCLSPQSVGGTSVTLSLYVEDADALYNRAVKAGATPVMPMADMFWGDRYGIAKDPYGHQWAFITHKEDVAPEEIGRRAAAAMAGGPGGCSSEGGAAPAKGPAPAKKK